MKHASLFSGIGGFDLAAEWMGWETVLQCEIDPFCQKVLRKHFPSSILYEDIRKLNGKRHRGEIDILTGGFPCQPFSTAGKRRGSEDDRFLWPEMLRIIREIQPRFIVGENVSGLSSIDGGMVLEQIYTDLEDAGYEVAPPLTIPACAVGAWHRRDRVWIVAHLNKDSEPAVTQHAKIQRKLDPSSDTNHNRKRNKRRWEKTISELRGVQRGEDQRIYADIAGRSDLSTPVLCRSYDGLPHGVDRVKACGNAIVPQVAYQIFKALPL